MLRAAKNSNGVIICIGNDEGQSGQYPSSGAALGEWCSWTVSSLPDLVGIADADIRALRFKENDAGDGIELRSDADVLSAPQG